LLKRYSGDEIIIRSYSKNDLGEIIKLYSKFQNLPYAYLSRDENFIKYYLKHYDVHADSVFISVKDSQITGFAIIAITIEDDVKYGNVIEFQAIDSQSAEKLIQKVEEYCSKKDVDAIIVALPPHLQKQKPIFLKQWVSFNPNIMIAKCVSPFNLLKQLFSINNKLKKRIKGKSVIFRIDGVAYEVNSIKDGVDIDIIQLSEIPKNKLIIDLTSQNLTKILFSRLNIVLAIITGKVKVNTIRKIGFVVKLLNDLRITDAVYVSPGDLV
jgi:uncharacterized protein YbaA (DUF1428 family)